MKKTIALLISLVLVFALAVPELDTNALFPVWSRGPGPVFEGALMVLNTFSLPLLILFWEERSTGPFRSGPFVGWCVAAVLTAFFSTLICLGLLGQTLVQSIAHPFFAVIRDLSVFSVLERMEALVIGLWVFSDFLLISLLLKTAAKLWCASLGLGRIVCSGARFFQLSGRRWLLWLCSLGALVSAELLSPNVYRLA